MNHIKKDVVVKVMKHVKRLIDSIDSRIERCNCDHSRAGCCRLLRELLAIAVKCLPDPEKTLSCDYTLGNLCRELCNIARRMERAPKKGPCAEQNFKEFPDLLTEQAAQLFTEIRGADLDKCKG